MDRIFPAGGLQQISQQADALFDSLLGQGGKADADMVMIRGAGVKGAAIGDEQAVFPGSLGELSRRGLRREGEPEGQSPQRGMPVYAGGQIGRGGTAGEGKLGGVEPADFLDMLLLDALPQIEVKDPLGEP